MLQDSGSFTYSERFSAGIPATKEQAIRYFQKLIQKSLSMDSSHWKWAAERVWEYYPEISVLIGIVPREDTKLMSEVLKWAALKDMQNENSHNL